MSEPAFTPGPWFFRQGDYEFDVYATPEPLAEPKPLWWLVCKTTSWSKADQANARLIAAAPDMLAALQTLLHEHVQLIDSGDCGFWDSNKSEEVIQARAAIAKAGGQS